MNFNPFFEKVNQLVNELNRENERLSLLIGESRAKLGAITYEIERLINNRSALAAQVRNVELNLEDFDKRTIRSYDKRYHEVDIKLTINQHNYDRVQAEYQLLKQHYQHNERLIQELNQLIANSRTEKINPAVSESQTAQTRLALRLEGLQPIDSHTQIDLEYLSCAEYQLFLDEMRQQHKYYQPDHWDGYHFPAATTNQPVTGLRGEDGQAFCEWLTRRQSQPGIRYRLPKLSEALKYQVDLPTLTPWCQQTYKYVLPELPASFEQLVRQTLSKLADTQLPLPACLDLFGLLLGSSEHLLADGLAPFLALDLSHALKLAAVVFLNTNLIRDRARACALDLAFEMDEVHRALEGGQFSKAQELLSPFLNDLELELVGRARVRMLYHLLEIAQAETALQLRRRWRSYSLQLSEYAYEGYEQLLKQAKPKPDSAKLKEAQEGSLNLYWWFQIIQARNEGKLPAWEGLRIVRERVE
jgi:hypothetical protein